MQKLSGNKRSRDEAYVKVEEALDVLKRQTARWTDKCGVELALFSKVERARPGEVVLRVGPLDSVSCARITELTSTRLPGDFRVSNYGVEWRDKAIFLHVVRGEAPRRNTLRLEPDVDATLVAFSGVAPSDVPRVKAVIVSVMRHEPDAVWTIHVMPATYVVRFRIKAIVCGAALEAAATADGVVDFEKTKLVVVVNKSNPDILD